MIKVKCKQDVCQWHEWFAWRPVTFDYKVVGTRRCKTKAFLSVIERKLLVGYFGENSWQYRVKAD